MKYFKRQNGELLENPIESNYSDLESITVKEFKKLLVIKNTLAPLTSKEKSDALKFAGIEFQGVLCSAEAQDMWGLSSIKEFIAAGNSTLFVFENGNTLLLTPDNLAEFQAVWIPFRLGFFK
tara:strand:- start:108 stop:473 length:366 start_codon:yes stop_codon:yes gene_type:complete